MKIYQSLLDIAKALLKGKLIKLNQHIRKGEEPQINNLSSHLEKERRKSKGDKCKEILRIRAEINETGNRKTV